MPLQSHLHLHPTKAEATGEPLRPAPATASTTAPASAPASGAARWQVRLLGAVEASDGHQHLQRFPSRAAAALLARLALAPDRTHAREELIELLWPGVALDIGRNRLRQALSALKSLLEPSGAEAFAVLHADRLGVRVLPGTLECDARRFEELLHAGDRRGARAQYRGELMPGHFEDWVVDERRRLAALFEDLHVEPPAPRSSLAMPLPAAPPLPSGLPSFWTRSIGTELTASRLCVLVCAQRLVTVHGPGGSGKTRLAVDVATALRDRLPMALQSMPAEAPFDRVVFVPLVDCVSAAQTLDAICSALHATGVGEARSRIGAALTGSRALLLLDNAEQLADDTPAALTGLLSDVPALHLLLTSRRLLDADGEHAFELDGLALPSPTATLPEAAINPALMLFVDRARAARAEFHLSERNLRALVGLVRLLSGMPLAIELAASRVRSMTPGELLQRLSLGAGAPTLDLLARNAGRTASGSTASSRHLSMRHVVDWSWRQLTPTQAALMQSMTVFGSSASAAAVAAVAGWPLALTQTTLDTLRDASLVRSAVDGDSGGGGGGGGGDGDDAADPAAPRHALLQPVREFAAECWTEADARAARRRLRDWLIGFAGVALPRGPTFVAVEIAHVHAAIVSAGADDAAMQAVELAVALRAYWDADDLPLSSLLALEQALGSLPPGPLRADGHELLAFGFGNAGLSAKASAHADAAIHHAGTDERRRALALARWVWSHYLSGHFGAELIISTIEEAARLAARSGDLAAQASVMRVEAPMRSNLLLDFAAAESLAERAEALWHQVGHATMARMALLNRATMWAWQGRNEASLPVFRRCEHEARAAGDWSGAQNAARQHGRVLIRLRRWPEAAEALRRSVELAWQRRYARGLANALLNLPEALLMDGQPEAAAQLHAFAQAHWARLFGTINRIEMAEQRRTRRLLRLAVGAPRLQVLSAAGRALDLQTAVALALALPLAPRAP